MKETEKNLSDKKVENNYSSNKQEPSAGFFLFCIMTVIFSSLILPFLLI